MNLYIQLRLYATLRKYIPAGISHYPFQPEETIQDLVDQLGIPKKQAKLIFINGKKGKLSSSLCNGDRVAIFPPVGGG